LERLVREKHLNILKTLINYRLNSFIAWEARTFTIKAYNDKLQLKGMFQIVASYL
jgi:hypothetical protein